MKAALLAGVSFFLLFAVLGYSQPLSGFLGAVGGIAAGWIANWWNSTEEAKEPASPQKVQREKSDRPRDGGIIATQKRMKSMRERRKLRDRASEQIFSWLKRQ